VTEPPGKTFTKQFWSELETNFSRIKYMVLEKSVPWWPEFTVPAGTTQMGSAI
jgi:hypothetical protein